MPKEKKDEKEFKLPDEQVGIERKKKWTKSVSSASEGEKKQGKNKTSNEKVNKLPKKVKYRF